MIAPYTRVIQHLINDLVRRHGLQPPQVALLYALVVHAGHTDGVWHGTKAEAAGMVGLHPTRIKPWLDRLQALGLIECHFTRGHGGWIRVLFYGDAVHQSPVRPVAPQQAVRLVRNERTA